MQTRILLDHIHWSYINLYHRLDRRKHIENEWRRTGMEAVYPLHRFHAHLPKDWPGPEAMVAKMRKQTPGAIGCYMSHRALWLQAVRHGKIAGVLEDDALLCDDFLKRLRYVETHFDRPWDVFYLGSTYHVNPPVWHKEDLGRDFELTDVKHIHRVYGAFANQGYLINPDSAQKLVDLVDQHIHKYPGNDTTLLHLQPQLNCFAFTPGMVFQIDNRSDIGNGMTIFSGFFKSLGPYCWTKRLEDFDYDHYDWAEGRIKTADPSK